ncbi:hypothetical protein V7128_03975 [Neobacillus vireti]
MIISKVPITFRKVLIKFSKEPINDSKVPITGGKVPINFLKPLVKIVTNKFRLFSAGFSSVELEFIIKTKGSVTV